ncbi:zinc-binding alcohol dehydrogenase family protein [Nocardioides anomalus]|uniref:Zinc-binding alcohol dehydrogenase family protein n=1 Tax=Nocardioides anomalus TaxID=2712223 RepID=A0A6G6WIP6_9ACTN|nr:zinc-binding alcohol dehydrogenase family protein [Nocardioides anomalus]QIG45076.1 zinc-binding alcohol dehydrogenase family protein [Nocardioides anomalus]
MRAVEVHTPGEPPRVVERAEPDGATVALLAAPITPLDLLCASGASYFGVPRTPYVPGVQGVGTLDGQPVWFPTSAGMAPGDGSMAERVAVPAGAAVPLPAGADPTEVAALGLSAVAALMALTWRGELAEGETVLVLGGGGVVGQAAVQLARRYGAARVVAAARSHEGQQRALAAGADAVVELGGEDLEELAGRLGRALDGPADLVLDPLYGVPAAAAARCLRSGGRLVNLGGSAAEHAPIDSSTLRSRSLRLLGYTNNELTLEQRAQAVATVAGHAAAGELAVAHEVVPLAGAPEAWRRQAAGLTSGRLVLVP